MVPEWYPDPDQPADFGAFGAANSVAWSPDGKLLIVASSSRCWLWDTSTWTNSNAWKAIGNCVVYSADGQRIAFDSEGVVQIRDTMTDGAGTKISGAGGRLHKISFSADGRQVYDGGDGNMVRMFALPTGDDWRAAASQHAKAIEPLEVREFVGQQGRVQDFAISPDRRTLATAGYDGAVGLWDLQPTGGSTPVLAFKILAPIETSIRRSPRLRLTG